MDMPLEAISADIMLLLVLLIRARPFVRERRFEEDKSRARALGSGILRCGKAFAEAAAVHKFSGAVLADLIKEA